MSVSVARPSSSSSSAKHDSEAFIRAVIAKDPDQPEFHQAVREVVESIWPFLEKNAKYKNARILDRMVEPERAISFRVPWRDDRGEIRVNRGYRVEFSSAIGPYKGGLRFHPTVNLGILKFLGFEQILKNSLTGLPMGGGKGGADFDPKEKSDAEVEHFCQSFMNELHRHIGSNTDVPAGDIGVGGREIGYMFGQYKKLRNEFSGVFTGKGLGWGGSLIRPEATGYGCVWFAEEMLKARGTSMRGKRVLISGSGNVAQYAVEKTLHLGGTPITLSDSHGTIHDEKGIDEKKLAWVLELKNEKRGRIEEYAKKFGARFIAGKKPWGVPGEVALPSATQNEIDRSDAETLVKQGCVCVAEGANMPSDPAGGGRVLEGEDRVRPGQGGERGRRGHVGPRDVAERHARTLAARRSGAAPSRDHGAHPRDLRAARQGRRLRELRPRCQRGRLHQGRRRDARPRLGLTRWIAAAILQSHSDCASDLTRCVRAGGGSRASPRDASAQLTPPSAERVAARPAPRAPAVAAHRRRARRGREARGRARRAARAGAPSPGSHRR